MIAAQAESDTRKQFARYSDATVAFIRAGCKTEAEKTVTTMKALVPKVEHGETVLVKTLREAADIEDRKDLLFGLTERLLELHPDDVESRFSLAYTYSQADQNELSLFHYLKIPVQEREEGTWNNLGVQFEHFELASKSVAAYRKAEELGNTLAMSNLAQKLIKAGFLAEAEAMCNRAVTIDNYHKNVGYAISRIKDVPEEEDKKEKHILYSAKELSDFYQNYGRATTENDIDDYSGCWRGPDCELQITIRANSFKAEGNYDVPRSTLAGLLLSGALLGPSSIGTSPQTDKYRITYSGEIHGHSINSTVIRQDVTYPSPTTLLTQPVNRKDALMVVSEDLGEIRVYEREKDSSKKGSFYKLARLD